MFNLCSENRGTGVCILAGHSIFVLVWSFKNRDNSTFSTLLTGHGTQHMSQKARCPAKNGIDNIFPIFHVKTQNFKHFYRSYTFCVLLHILQII